MSELEQDKVITFWDTVYNRSYSPVGTGDVESEVERVEVSGGPGSVTQAHLQEHKWYAV